MSARAIIRAVGRAATVRPSLARGRGPD